LNDNKIVITSTTIYSKENLIYDYLNRYSNENYNFSVNCNENYTKCEIRKMNVENGSLIEQHVVNIEYKEQFSDLYKSLLTDGVFHFKAIKPANASEIEFMLYNYVISLSNKEYEVWFGGCNEEFDECEITIYKDELTETHVVKATFEKTDKEIKNNLDNYIKNLDVFKVEEDERKVLKLDLVDLEMINYYATTKSKSFDYTKLNEMFGYSQTIKKAFEGNNYKFVYDCRMGDDTPFHSYAEGGLSILYNDVFYGVAENVGTTAKNILYVPSETKLTNDALIKAAKDKIKNYLPKLDINITVGQSFDNYLIEEDMEPIDLTDVIKEFIDLDKTVNNVFVVDFGSFKVDFLIVADSSKTIKTEFLTNDIDSNISIASTSSEIPLDTVIKVEKVNSGKEYERIIKILDIEENEMYDLSLYSSARDEYIKKLEDSTFEVKIPIPKKFDGKNLVVYYVDVDGVVTEHEVTVKDGYAVFTTDHFSIYTLAIQNKIQENTPDKPSDNPVIPDDDKEDNETQPDVPKTFDGINTSIIIGVTSLIVLLISIVVLKKRNKLKN